MGHHIYEYAKSKRAKSLIMDYIRNRSEGLSKKDKENLIA